MSLAALPRSAYEGGTAMMLDKTKLEIRMWKSNNHKVVIIIIDAHFLKDLFAYSNFILIADEAFW